VGVFNQKEGTGWQQNTLSCLANFYWSQLLSLFGCFSSSIYLPLGTSLCLYASLFVVHLDSTPLTPTSKFSFFFFFLIFFFVRKSIFIPGIWQSS
jgi:hypothetical protein